MARPDIAFDWLNGDVRDLQARYEQAFAQPLTERCQWQSFDAGGRSIAMLVHRPARPAKSDCGLVYFHGGGWIVGSPATHADISQPLCEAAGLQVFSVAYRLAPQHPAPAPIEDGLAALSHVLENTCRSVVLCGDSAGAAIALAVERAATASLREKIRGVSALYGFYGRLSDASSRPWGRREDGMDEASVRRYWRLANPIEGQSPYSVEALASASTVPAYLMAAGADPLHDDTIALAAALKSIGREVTIETAEGQPHGFLHRANGSPAVAAELRKIAEWIRSTAVG